MLKPLTRLVVAGVLVALVGACASRSAEPVDSGGAQVSNVERDALSSLLARLGTSSLLDEATLVLPPPRPAGDVTEAHPTDLWLSLSSAATGLAERNEAVWQAEIVISALWRDLRDTGSNTFRGGALTFATPAEDGTSDGVTEWLPPDADSYLFTDASGKPSALTADVEDVRATIDAAAPSMGLTVESVDFISVIGTNVKVVATANDPKTFAQTYPSGYGTLFGDDIGRLEGVLLVVNDPEGNLVKVASYSTGAQAGQGRLGPTYDLPLPTDASGSALPLGH